MTLTEAIRESWPTMRRGPLPSTVEECKQHRDSGYGTTVENDRYGVTLNFFSGKVTARLVDYEALENWDIDHGEVEKADWSFREFVEAMNTDRQLSIFEAVS